MSYSGKVIDHLGLISGMVDELGIVDVIDKTIKQDKEKRHISIGQTLKALILNGLGFTGRPLYLTPQFFETKPTELLIGEGILAEHINENTIGRAMDTLYKTGVSNLFSLISAKAFEALKLKPEFAHLDSTSFSLYGNEYNPSDKFITQDEDGNDTRPCVVEITQGYSKDHRPDLAQVMLNMIVENKAGIPTAIEVMSGNSSDKASFATTAATYTSMISQTTNACVVADSAIYSKENLGILKDASLNWITRVPETMKESKEAIEKTIVSEMIEQAQDERYTYKATTSSYGDVEQIWIVVHSSEAHSRTIRTLLRRYTKQSNTEKLLMSKLEKECFSCESEALKAIERFTKALKLTTIQTRIVTLPKYTKSGRPAKGQTPNSWQYNIVCTPISSSLVSYQKDLHQGSCFILASNDLSKKPQEIMDAYKNQYVVEKGFAFLKSKEFFSDSFYLKSPERIEALLMIMALSLMTYTALEYRIRYELKDKDQTFNNQKGKPTQKPTVRWIFQCFEGIQLLYIGELNKSIVLNLNKEHRRIISLLGPHYERIYFFGDLV